MFSKVTGFPNNYVFNLINKVPQKYKPKSEPRTPKSNKGANSNSQRLFMKMQDNMALSCLKAVQQVATLDQMLQNIIFNSRFKTFVDYFTSIVCNREAYISYYICFSGIQKQSTDGSTSC